MIATALFIFNSLTVLVVEIYEIRTYFRHLSLTIPAHNALFDFFGYFLQNL